MNKIYKNSILFLTCVCLFSAANLTAQNLLINPSFETGELVPWTAGNGNIVNIIEGGTDGMYAADGNIEQIVSLEAGKMYTWTTQVRCDSACDKNMWIGIKDLVGDALVTNFNFNSHTDFAEAKIEFEAPSTGNHRFWVWGVAETQYTSDQHLLLAEGTTDITEVEAELNKIEITNNPEGVRVRIDESIDDASIEIYNLTGQMIYRGKASGDTLINNSEFSATGIYVVSVRTDIALKSEKVAISLN